MDTLAFGYIPVSYTHLDVYKRQEDILAGGDADFIGMGRGLIADPEWVSKVEFGNVCDIRKCISCNIGCAGHRIGLNQPIRCTVTVSYTHLPYLFYLYGFVNKKTYKKCIKY